MPRLTVMAALLVLVLLPFAVPSASAQDGLAAQPQELWEEFPLDSEKQQPPKPEERQSPQPEPEQSAPSEPEQQQPAPQTPAPSEGERVANEAGDGGEGIALWLLPVLGLLAFIAGVLAAKAALRFTRKRRQSAHGRPASAEPAAARPQSKPAAAGRVEAPATALAAAAGRTTAAPKPADQPVVPAKKPAPATAAKPAPVKEQKPAPVEEGKRAPDKQKRPTPVTAEKPAPAKPAPAKAERPAPVAPAKPVVAKAEKPATAKTEKPAAAKTEKPAPVAPPTPAPVVAKKPAGAREQKPTPVRAQEPAPPKDPTARPAEAQKPKLEAAAPEPSKESRGLPDDVIPFPTRADRIGRRSGASTPARALGYVSAADTDGQASDLEAQTEEIRKACVRNGFESVEVVRDFESHSGSDLERPGLIYAIERLEAGEATCLVVTSLERLTRSAAHLGTLIDRLGESKIRLVVLDIQLDTGNPDGRLAAEALANVGTLERKSLDTRTRKGLDAARDARRSSGRPAVADRPALKERIGDMRARGMTLQAIADTLNSEGVPTLRGGAEWRPSSVQAAVGYKRPKRGARKSPNGRAGGPPDPKVNGVSGRSVPADDR